jgi:hypothetical protein
MDGPRHHTLRTIDAASEAVTLRGMNAARWMRVALGASIVVSSCGGGDDAPTPGNAAGISGADGGAGANDAGATGASMSGTRATAGANATEGGAAGTGATVGEGADSAVGGQTGKGEGGSPADTSGGGVPPCAQGDCGGAAGEAGSGNSSVQGPVSGTVVWYGDVPAAGVAVVLNRESVTATDAQGHFSFPDPGPEYELSLISETRHRVLVLEGLHGRTPKIRNVASLAPKKGSAGGALTGDIGSASQTLNMAFVAGETALWDNQSDLSLPHAGKATYSMNVGWQSADSVSGSLLFLITGAGHSISYGEKKTTLTTAANPPAVDVALTAIGERTVTVNTAPVPNNFIADLRVLVGPFELPCGDLPAQTSCVVPDSPLLVPAIYELGIGGNDNFLESARSVPATGALNLALPSLSTPILPPTNATGVNPSTDFSWTKPSLGMVWQISFYASPYLVQVITAESHTTLPDLTKYGVAYSANSSGSWQVQSLGPATSVDDVTTFAGYDGNLADMPGGWAMKDFDYSMATERTFKTAP